MVFSTDFALVLLLAGLLPGSSPLAGQLGFEATPAGAFQSLETSLGVWNVRSGNAAIDNAHARGGERCLHLAGGEGERASVVELKLPEELASETQLSFWIERWTKRAPFLFSLEAYRAGVWRELHDGSSTVSVGGFDTHVTLDLQAGTSALRFTCEAPANTGVLIDDLSLEPAKPMELVSVSVRQPRLPVLVGNRVNPVLHIQVRTEGSLDPLALEEVVLDLTGTSHPQDVASVSVVLNQDEPGQLPPGNGAPTVFGQTPAGWTMTGESLHFASSLPLRAGVNDLWVSVQLKPEAHIDGFVDAHALGIRLTGQEAILEPAESPEDARHRQRIGVALRNGGDDDCEVFRIPGLVSTPKGTLIGVYDVRWRGWGDLPGDIDVGLSRSTDGGRHWEPMQVIMDMGSDPQWRHDGVGDPALLVDRNTGRIFVMATWSHGDRSWRGSGPGLEPTETGQLMLAHSDDEGLTWSKPRNLTKMLKKPEWSFLLQGPGRGITMSDGTLVFPAQFQLSPEEARVPYSTILWSRDHGETWQVGTGALSDTTESAVVELVRGTLMSNQRNNRGGLRTVFVTPDLGRTWAEHSSSRSSLRGPVCMASLIHVGQELNGQSDGTLLFSNPDVERAPRRGISIKASRDMGSSWPAGQTLLLDEGRSAGYSCLTMIDAKTVGILYEGSRAQMTFQRVPLADILAGGEAGE